MDLSDALQTFSLAAVAVALLLNYRQARATGMQAAETAKQVQISSSLLKQEVARNLDHYATEFNVPFLVSDERLLAWFLGTRGIPIGSHTENLRSLFLFNRIDVHASTYAGYRSRLLEEDVWNGWRRVVELDVATPEFQVLWPHVRDQYSSQVVELIETVLREQRAAT
ncbi:hypothetical protein [Actinoplanes aureus]|uniref:Uncharacterized protein n=1 Tax=Actinoplanes aureus TaxID=2792083 RepID=A0A931C3Y5_9ACTN|nr:hypothetical protein [Actinoplanes aureus]MBG0562970.1 hypothetical protein [Actinoplanes aureus]